MLRGDHAACAGCASAFCDTVILSPRLSAMPCVLLRMRMCPVTFLLGAFSRHTLDSASSPMHRHRSPSHPLLTMRSAPDNLHEDTNGVGSVPKMLRA